jgi:sugar lactone lactonase YvrE
LGPGALVGLPCTVASVAFRKVYEMRIKPAQSLMSLCVVMIGLLVASATAAASGSAAPYTYVANYDGWTVTEYAKNASGDQPPVAVIEGDRTGLRNPAGLTLNSAGRLFVTNYGADSVTEYASGAAGNVAPIATIKGSRTRLARPEGIALDAAGDLFVTNYGDASVTEYAPGAVGDVAPIATIKGSKTGLSYPEGVFVEPSGALMVANTFGNSVNRYEAGANGDVAPISVLKGSNTALNTPVGVVVTATGTMYVGNSARGAVAEYAKGATGDARPITEYTQGLRNPEGLALTPEGDVLVADRAGAGGRSAVETITPGNPNPIATINGRLTELNGPIGVAVVPPAPARPGAPTIGQATAGDGSASVTFKAPAENGGPPITSYTVTAKDLTDPAAGGQTASGKDSPITVGGLTNGDSYTLSVTASNAGGAGPASSSSNTVMPRAYIYVTGDDNVNEYGPGGNAPIAAIKGPHTELQFPTGLAFGPTGKLFTAARTGGGVNEYASGATGDASPIARIRGGEPGGIAVDAGGNLFVAYPQENSVTKYAETATGELAAVATIKGAQTGLDGPEGVAVDAAGNLFVSNVLSRSVTEYAKGATGNATPLATIKGDDTGIHEPVALAINPAGKLFVSNYGNDSVTEYASGANGNATPVATIIGDRTGLQHPSGLAVDRSGNLIVANSDGASVTEYRKGATGNVAPFATISGPAAQLRDPWAVAVVPPLAPKSPRPPSPSNRFKVSRIRFSTNGTISFRINVPNRGKISVLETASNHGLTRTAPSKQPAPRWFVYARKHLRISKAGRWTVVVAPNRRGRRLLAHQHGSFAIRLSITYTPRGGTHRTIGPYRILITGPNAPAGRG